MQDQIRSHCSLCLSRLTQVLRKLCISSMTSIQFMALHCSSAAFWCMTRPYRRQQYTPPELRTTGTASENEQNQACCTVLGPLCLRAPTKKHHSTTTQRTMICERVDALVCLQFTDQYYQKTWRVMVARCCTLCINRNHTTKQSRQIFSYTWGPSRSHT